MINKILHWNAPQGKYLLMPVTALIDDPQTGPRFARALGLASAGHVRHVDRSLWRVTSQSNHAQEYVVTTLSGTNPTCTCPDFTERQHLCKHIMAVELHVIANATVKGQAQNASIPTVTQYYDYQLRQPHTGNDNFFVMILHQAAHSLREATQSFEDYHPPISALQGDCQVPALQLRYWWPGTHPERFLDDTCAPTYDDDVTGIQVWWPQEPQFRHALIPPQEIRDYITDHELHIGHITIVTNRRKGRWEGLYNIPLHRPAAASAAVSA